MDAVDPGLCGSCRHARVIVSGKGARFYQCTLARVDSRFKKYPPLPVRACVGFEQLDPPAE
jgi:hypothetical protein